MEKIKIVRREYFYEDSYHTYYDIYYGFTGIPLTWPFMTKWVCDKADLTEDEMLKRMKTHLTTKGKVKVIVKAVRQY